MYIRREALHCVGSSPVLITGHSVSFSAACEPEGNLLLMNVIKTNESHFLLWYKQFVISHEDSIIVDFHLVMLIIEKKKKRLRVKLSLAFCLGLCAPSNGTARFI